MANATPRMLENSETVRAPAPLDPEVDEATDAVPARVPAPEPAPVAVGLEEAPVAVARERESV
jgi:hypothetical protein